ncbi:MAG: peptide chain release factor 2 [Saccharofermentanales bacterium]|nr:peptide chain release factor 2 [Bacillota bacterium]NLU55441.1 peptide chain release factor 2 [Bacillota bacterium]HOA90619.1 peptide chain release factor 2 [Bacillota bacterium]HOJ45709.1 peptide chain release factor 2 [Bacillota bacterium]HOL13506.1 peptide chain release factor 2 [Bacillota bacterium]
MSIFERSKVDERISALEQEVLAPNFWSDQRLAQKKTKELNELKESRDTLQKLARDLEDLKVLLDLAVSEEDGDTLNDVIAESERLLKFAERYELEMLLNGPYDSSDALLTIHPGAGGTESQDWGSMLYRMYMRWAEINDYTAKVLDFQPGDEAGIKSVTISISGPYAYGYLKAEAGVHRLVRISPFDSAGRRHTSFCSVDVIPQISDAGEIEIDPKDLEIDTYRSGGAGGQHVNKTDSAVRITHIPTGIVVQCQNERSQHANKETAMNMLMSKLVALKLQKQKEELEAIRGEKAENTWGSQIRSYVFCPYTMVKDHRTGLETGNVDAVMDGAIQDFIEAYLRMK